MDEQKARGNARMKRIIRGTPAAGPARWVSIRFGGGNYGATSPGPSDGPDPENILRRTT